MRLDGISPTMIARTLSDEKISPPSIYSGRNIKKTFTTYLWGISTINQILSNPIYIGNLVQRKYDKVNYKSKKKVKLSEEDWIITQNCVPPIISKESFKTVQNMKKNNIKRNSKGYNYLLKGLVVCGDCGRSMSVRRRVNKRKTKDDQVEIYYCCSNYIRYRNSVCSLHYFREEKLNEIVINYLKNIFSEYANKKDLESIANHKENNINVDEEKALKWLNNGAQPSDTVRNILSRQAFLLQPLFPDVHHSYLRMHERGLRFLCLSRT